MRKIFIVFLAAVVGGIIGVYSFVLFGGAQKEIVRVETQQVVPSARFASYAPNETGSFVDAAEKSVEAVVHVMTKANAKQGANSGYGNPFYDFFFGPRGQAPQQNHVMGSGSGVIISQDGYIVTNNHVIDGADEIEVILNDKRSYTATLVGTDPSTDIALLKIEEKGLAYLTYGDSDALKIGEWVLAVGNPFNLTSTVTAGIVSAKSRSINILSNRNSPMGIESFIQTDAAVNPGNSGGALVDTRGNLVGINTAIASKTGSFTGYSFAVPVTIVRKVVSDLREYGEVQRAFLGVQIRDINADLAKEKNLKSVKGVYVAGVTVNGGAAEAGIQEGDVIVRIDGVVVNTNSQLIEQISTHRPGDKIKVDINRNGSEKTLDVLLRNSYGSTDVVKDNTGITALLGAKFRPINAEEQQRFGINYGVVVEKLMDGKLKSAGVKQGYIILKANNQRLQGLDDMKMVIASVDDGLFLSGIYPNGSIKYYAINIQD